MTNGRYRLDSSVGCWAVFIAGAGTMITELAAGRLVAAYVGQSIYTWTAVIGVFMAGISLGSYAAGRLTVRLDAWKLMASLFVLSCLSSLLIPSVNSIVGSIELMRRIPFGLRLVLHVTLVFLPFAAFMGGVMPAASARVLSSPERRGVKTGLLFAAGTAGSIAGTFLAGFVLIGFMGVSKICMLVGLAMGITGAALFRRPEAGGAPARAGGVEAGSGTLPGLKYVVAVFLAGFSVMVLEINAGRLASRYFGYSIYSWTSVLGVVLGGLSAGNYLGGRLSERSGFGRVFPFLFTLAALACVITPGLNRALGEGRALLYFDLSWRARIVAHVVLVFLAPSVLSGMLLPAIVSRALGSGVSSGMAVGTLYSSSALGNIAGVFIAGFVLVPAAGTGVTAAAAAVVLAVAGLFPSRRGVAAWIGLAVTAVLLVSCFTPFPLLGLGEKCPPAVVYRDESRYADIRIMETPDKPGIRSFHIDKLVHSKINMNDPVDLQYPYSRIYAAILRKHFPADQPISALIMGGGGYVFPRYIELKYPAGHVEVAEIDPAVTRAAREAFGLPADSGIQSFNCDARRYVTMQVRSGRKDTYDCIIGDTCNDYNVPFHLTTLEFVRDLDFLLKEKGFYLLNVMDSQAHGRLLGSVVNTCREVFPFVTVFMSREKPEDRDTFTVVCSRHDYRLDDIAEWMPVGYVFEGRAFTASEYAELAEHSKGMVLTDDFAPVENLLAEVIARTPNDRDKLLVKYAYRLKEQGEYARAVSVYEEVLGRHPDRAGVRESYALALAGTGDTAAAEREWKKITENDPDTWRAHYNLGMVYHKSGRLEQAAAEWEKVRKLNPGVKKVYSRLGLNYLARGKLEESADAFRAGLAVDPAQPDMYKSLATVLFALKDYEGAREAVKKCREFGGDPGAKLVKALEAVK